MVSNREHTRPLRILVNDYCGHPFQAQLSRQLAAGGHTVLHTWCSSYTTGRGSLEHMPGDPPTLAFEALDLGAQFAKHSIIRRFRQERHFGKLLQRAAGEFKPDVIISANTPLFAQRRIMGWARRRGVRFVYWLQDVISTAMGAELKKRLPLVGLLPGSYVASLERGLLRSSDAIVAITHDFDGQLADWGVAPDRVAVIENWAPLDEMPLRPRRNEWAGTHGLSDAFVFLYAGTLGLKHDPELLVQLAISARQDDAVRVVVVSEGAGADFCRTRARQEHLRNLIVLPFQPYQLLPDVLASGDVLVTILEPAAGVFSVPSKVLSYHCAGRPILASVPDGNLAARVIQSAQSGIVVRPGDASGLAAAASRLSGDAALRQRLGQNAREYAERTFDIQSISARFEALLHAASDDVPSESTKKGLVNAH